MFTARRSTGLSAERLHPVDEVADAVRLVADQDGQLTVGVGDAAFEQLGRAADAGKGVLDLVRQDGGHAGDAAGGAAEVHLPVERASGRAVLHGQDDRAVLLRQRRRLDRDAAAAQARAFDADVVVGDGQAMGADLANDLHERAVGGDHVGQAELFQLMQREAEVLFGGVVGEAEPVLGVQQDHGHGQGAQHGGVIGDGARRRAVQHRRACPGQWVSQAAIAGWSISGSNRPSIRRRTSRRSVRRMAVARELGGAGQTVRVPGEVLAGETQAGIVAEMGEHGVVVAEQDGFADRDGRLGHAASGAQELGDVGREPGAAVRAAADHDAIGAGLAQGFGGVVRGQDVAVGDHGDAHGGLDAGDEGPVGAAGIHLLAGAAVDRHHADAAVLRDAGECGGVEVGVVPSPCAS